MNVLSQIPLTSSRRALFASLSLHAVAVLVLFITVETQQAALQPPASLQAIEVSLVTPDATQVQPTLTPAKPIPQPSPTHGKSKNKPRPAHHADEAAPNVPSSEAAPASAASAASTANANLSSSGNASREADYFSMLRAVLERHKHYPPEAVAARTEGEAWVRFTINRRGEVLAALVTRSSGSGLLDDAAMSAVHQASPLPEMPQEIASNDLTITVPFGFHVR